MMPRAADEADRRLQADDAVDRGRTDDAAVGLGADTDGGEAGGDRAAGAGARAARIAVEQVRVSRLSAAAAPTRRRTRRAEIRPFTQVGLAENNGTRVAQPRDQERVLLRAIVRRARATRPS